MKKRFFGILLMGAMVVASMSTFTSCKDYDDDIARIEKSINENSEKIKAIQALISNGGVVTGVTPIENGVRVTMSGNLGSFDILNGKDGQNGRDGVDGKNGVDGQNGQNGLNGKDGKDGTVWTIEADGFWYLNGAKTEYYALGTSAGSTTTTIIEASPKYYVPNPATGCFDIYQEGVLVERTTISFLGTGSITATMDNDMLTLYGIAGALGPNNSVAISMTSALKSMVFIPGLYLDGIESVEYPWLADTILKMYTQPDFENLGHHGTVLGNKQDIFGEKNDYYPNTLGRYYNRTTKQIETTFDPNDPGYVATRDMIAFEKSGALYGSIKEGDWTDRDNLSVRHNKNRHREYIYGPAWEIDYHLNPANAKVDYDTNNPDFNVLEPDVIYYNTRATDGKKYTWGTFSVGSPKAFWNRGYKSEKVNKYNSALCSAYDANTYKNNEGTLNAGIQITAPEYLAPWPTDETINPNGNYTDNKDVEANTSAKYGADPDYECWYGFARYEELQSADHNHQRYNENQKNTDNTVALQVNKTDGDETTVTSDYALIVPTRVQLEGLIWYQKPQYIEPDQIKKDGTYWGYGPGNQTGDEEGWFDQTERIHVWDSPEEAIADPRGASLELGALDPNGVDLTKYLAIHAVKESIYNREKILNGKQQPGNYDNAAAYDLFTIKYGEEKAFGLHYEFELVDYIASTNGTRDSRYATFSDWTATESHTYNNVAYDIVKDWNKKEGNNNSKVVNTSKTGVIIARDITPDGFTATTQARSTVDREPLVRVLVKTEAGEVVLDGYILLHIFYTPDNLHIQDYPEITIDFDLCNPKQYQTTWSEFSRYILTDKMSEAEKRAFDDWYWADCIDGDQPVRTEDERYVTPNAYRVSDNGVSDEHMRGYQLKIFNLGDDIFGNNPIDPVKAGNHNDKIDNGRTTKGFEKKALGDMVWYCNGEGITNHIFKWVISEEELEALTHHFDEISTIKPVKVTRWFRFVAKDLVRGRDVNNYSSAPYPYVWVKVTFNITRKPLVEHFTEKNLNYWYHWNPTAEIETAGTGLNETQVKEGWSAIAIDIQAPRDGETTKDEPWKNRTSKTLVGNKVDLTATAQCKYYFAPKEQKVIKTLTDFVNASSSVEKQEEWTLTPKNGDWTQNEDLPNHKVEIKTNLNTWNKMFCKYVWPHTYVDMNEPYADSPAKGYYAGVTPYKLDAYLPEITASDSHEWDEATLEATLRWCSVIYDNENGRDAGVFNDTILYAYSSSSSFLGKHYIPVARLVHTTDRNKVDTNASRFVKNDDATWPDAGAIELIHYLPVGKTADDYKDYQAAVKAGTAAGMEPVYLNTVTERILNALGYPLKADGTCDFDYAHRFMNHEFRAWVGVVAVNNCNVAVYMDQVKHDDDNVATFLASWQRPINIDVTPIDVALDANTQENYVFMIDHLRLYDWRGNKPNQGYMWDDHYYFWAYYNVKAIEVDMNPKHIWTNMHGAERVAAGKSEWTWLSEVTTMARLFNIDVLNPNTATARVVPGTADLKRYEFDLVDAAKKFTYAVNNDALKAYMGVKPESKTNKARFGGFYYANNGDNVTEFDVVIPIKVYYEWGWVNAKLDWHINTTHGRNY